MGHFHKSGLAIGTAAILATSVTPAVAAVSLDRGHSVLKSAGEYDGWGRRHRYRHRDRVDGGDILTGIAILAGIAIVADAAGKSGDNRPDDNRYPTRDRSYENEPDYSREAGTETNRSNDVASAVDVCSNAAQRDGARVDEVTSVTRNGAGWRVEGRVSGGNEDEFTCGATNGEVDFIQFGDRDI